MMRGLKLCRPTRYETPKKGWGVWPHSALIFGVIVSALMLCVRVSHAQELLSSLGGLIKSAPTQTSDHHDGHADRAVPSGAKYCWVATASGNDIGVVHRSDGTYFGILYSSYVGYDIRTSLNHSIQKSVPRNRTEVSITLSRDSKSGGIAFKRVATGVLKKVSFAWGDCPTTKTAL